MPSESSVVLPDSLISDLVTQIGDVSKILQQEISILNDRRDEIRSRMKESSGDLKLGTLPGFVHPVISEPDFQIHAIDGAHIAKSDRGAAYSLSCVVGLSPSGQISRQRICTAVMPHFVGLSAISSGLMTMQEIMMAVELAESSPTSLILIDGSRLSAFISINQFYEAMLKDGLDTLREWRNRASSGKSDGAGTVIADFERRDWMTPFLSLPNIIGNLKLVTTKSLIKKYARDLLHSKGPGQLIHLYARVNPIHGVYKIEFNHGLLSQKSLGSDSKEILGRLVQWWGWNTAAIDIMEPYPSYVADRFVSEAVKVSEMALRDILIRESTTDALWNLGRPYRT